MRSWHGQDEVSPHVQLHSGKLTFYLCSSAFALFGSYFGVVLQMQESLQNVCTESNICSSSLVKTFLMLILKIFKPCPDQWHATHRLTHTKRSGTTCTSAFSSPCTHVAAHNHALLFIYSTDSFWPQLIAYDLPHLRFHSRALSLPSTDQRERKLTNSGGFYTVRFEPLNWLADMQSGGNCSACSLPSTTQSKHTRKRQHPNEEERQTGMLKCCTSFLSVLD